MISIEDFAKTEIKTGLVLEAAAVEGSGKLIREVVDFGDEKRVIFSGIRKWYQPEELVGNKYLYVTNLAPRKMPSYVKNPEGETVQEESNGMILAVDGPEGKPILVQMPDEAPVGAKIR